MKTGLAFIIAVGLSGTALADEVKLTDGRTLEGIVRHEPGRVVVETGRGTITVPAETVGTIVPGRSILHDYLERVVALGMQPTAAQVFETALWARDHRLVRYVNPLLQWTLAIDPDHAQARKMLDYVLYNGCWIPSRELEAHAKPQDRDADRRTVAEPRKAELKKRRPQPEISPGYVYFGIPPSAPSRGSQNHDYGGYWSFSYPLTPAYRGGMVTR